MESALVFFDWYVDFVEAKGGEWSLAIFWSTISIVMLAIAYFSWKLTTRKPLGYELFLVEMHHFENRRVVEMLHLPSRGRSTDHWFSDDIRVMRERVSRRSDTTDGSWISVSEPTVLTSGPATVMHPSSRRIQSHGGAILWEIEMHATDTNIEGDRHLAAAAAIAILSRPNLPVTERLSFHIVEGNDPAIAEMNSPIIRAQMSRHSPHVIQLPVFNFPMDIVEASYTGALSVPPGDLGYVQYRGGADITGMHETDLEVAMASEVEEATAVDGTHEEARILSVEDNSIQETQESDPMNVSDVDADAVTIRIKFLDDTEKELQTPLNLEIGSFKSRFFSEAVANQKVIRLIYQGQLLRDDSRTLQSYGIQDGSVVHCAIGNKPYTQPVPKTSTSTTSHPIHPNVENRSTSESDQTRRDEQLHQDAVHHRTDLWFARVIFALITSNLATAPLIVRDWIFRMFEVIRPPVATPDDSSPLRFYRNWYTLFVVPLLPVEDLDPVATASEAAARRQHTFCIGDYMYWIFGVQCAVVWAFVYSFPQLRDRTSLGILALFTLYLFFVVLRYSRVPPTQHDRTANTNSSRRASHTTSSH